MSEELKPCPFCGGEPQIRQIGNEHTKKCIVEVRCKTLGCRGSCEGQGAPRGRQSIEKITQWGIDQWNRRAESRARDEVVVYEETKLAGWTTATPTNIGGG